MFYKTRELAEDLGSDRKTVMDPSLLKPLH